MNGHSPLPADPNPILVGERNVLELVATGAELPAVLDALCAVIDEQTGRMSSVFLLDRSGKQLTLAAGPHLPAAWRKATRTFEATPTNTSCGAAVHSRSQVIVADVATSPLFTPWRDEARRSRIASVWSTPFFSKDDNVLGTFAVLSDEPGGPDAAQLHAVDRAKRLASIAVERHQTEEILRESERRFSTAFYSSPASLSITRAADGRFMYVNDRFVTLFEYSRDDVIGRTPIALGLYADNTDQVFLYRLLHEHEHRAFEAKARTKSGSAVDVLIWMERIQILGEESILTVTCDITDRLRAEAALTESARLLRVMLDTLPVGVVVVNRAGDIIFSNPASRRIWGEVIDSGPERYARSKAWWHDTGKILAADDWGSVRALTAGESSDDIVDIESFDGIRKIVRNSAVPIRDPSGRITGAVVVNDDLSDEMAARHDLEQSLAEMRALSGRLMRAQDDERRRIAQMLHETTAQDLAALKMHLARVTRTQAPLPDGDRAALAESVELAERSMSGIRTLSYLLHPPFLDESGLLSALRWYAKGFSERSGISVELDLPGAFERLPQEVETTLFRVVQEALINVHHHAGSASAVIRLRVDRGQLTLEIEDRGRGMRPDVVAQFPIGGGPLGLGVVGMRERLQQLGGTLDIESGDGGTLLRASIPRTVNVT